MMETIWILTPPHNWAVWSRQLNLTRRASDSVQRGQNFHSKKIFGFSCSYISQFLGLESFESNHIRFGSKESQRALYICFLFSTKSLHKLYNFFFYLFETKKSMTYPWLIWYLLCTSWAVLKFASMLFLPLKCWDCFCFGIKSVCVSRNERTMATNGIQSQS